MVCWRVCDVVECFARNSDDMRLANFKLVHARDREWKLLRRPAEHNLPTASALRTWQLMLDSAAGNGQRRGAIK